MTLLLSSNLGNCLPFPSIWRNFTLHNVELCNSVISHIIYSEIRQNFSNSVNWLYLIIYQLVTCLFLSSTCSHCLPVSHLVCLSLVCLPVSYLLCLSLIVSLSLIWFVCLSFVCLSLICFVCLSLSPCLSFGLSVSHLSTCLLFALSVSHLNACLTFVCLSPAISQSLAVPPARCFCRLS